MKLRTTRVVLVLVMVLASSSSVAWAQEWRGQGRVAGKVVDDGGAPIEGVTVAATLPASQNRGPNPGKTNAKGEWSVGGLARGNWALDFSRDGYETLSISVPVSEGSRIPPMTITLKKVVVTVDPNAVIKAKLTEAAALMNAKQFAQARAIYESLAAEYPEVKQFRPLIARAYAGEGNLEKAIETLRAAVAADPANAETQVLLGTVLIEAGKLAEGQQVLGAVDATKITDPITLVNIGIGLINDKKQEEAIVWLTKAVQVFPNDPNAYYYRGISYLALGKTTEAKADLEKFIAIAPPTASELDAAKKILATIK